MEEQEVAAQNRVELRLGRHLRVEPLPLDPVEQVAVGIAHQIFQFLDPNELSCREPNLQDENHDYSGEQDKTDTELHEGDTSDAMVGLKHGEDREQGERDGAELAGNRP